MKSDKEILSGIEERLYDEGVGELTDSELVALIIRKGDSTKSVLELSNNIIRRYGASLRDLIGITREELKNDNPGMTDLKCDMILASLEIGRRAYLKKEKQKIISCVMDIVDLLSYDMSFLDEEHFKVILLNTKNMVIETELISIGTINTSLVHVREVFRNAIKKNANSIILAHNHPSGDSTPSIEDEHLTKRLKDAGELIGIKVIDHVIIGKDNYFSFMEENML
ncbi:DNA repair protein RadC [Anaerofustis stercorihominis]|uniref:RadC family protein n=1 Tax=Anaerofustis stercorihominis TaxID=214853 RepID=UPI00210ADE6B|nr:DNA repair protein RadC [Anaerofustis stercorihominis]MCQ4795213.1 DNA repair protein RadC [Anaerofustis stercorihominis]